VGAGARAEENQKEIEAESSAGIEIQVCTLDGKVTDIEVLPSQLIADVKWEVLQKLGIPVHQQRLFKIRFDDDGGEGSGGDGDDVGDGEQLENASSVESIGLRSGDQLVLTVWHMRLALDGKCRLVGEFIVDDGEARAILELGKVHLLQPAGPPGGVFDLSY
jgi:hypothetical protein